MKKILLLTLMVFGMTTLMAQNQFRDYVSFRQGQFEQNRPKIERRDGKVIIVMTEDQFRQMQHRREMMKRRINVGPHGIGPRFAPQPPKCEKCRRHMKRHKRHH
jgi:hypothetical protein